MKKGKFIVFEGIDGSGKTTQGECLYKRLCGMGIRAHLTKEPTDGEIGLLIRRILRKEIIMTENAMPLLFAADRSDHIFGTGGLKKLVDSGVTVICDRYYFSSYAYNSVDTGMDWTISLNGYNRSALRPDCTVFIDLSIKKAMERIAQTREAAELYENEERLSEVRRRFFAAFEKVDDKVEIINADDSIDNVSEKVWERIKYLFEE